MSQAPQLYRAAAPIIDTHCHLDYLDNDVLDETLKLCSQVNVSKLITISVQPSNLETVAQLASHYDQVYFTQGIHPHYASEYNQNIAPLLSTHLKNSKHPKLVAIGEIGLDFHYNKSSPKQQHEAFQAQLELAIHHNLPIVIHSREADQEMIKYLREYAPKLKRKGVVHSFSSSQALAECALEEDFYLGFNGIVTFKNAKDIQSTLKIVPQDKLILETDSPYLAPTPMRGKKNSPYFLPYVAKFISDLRHTSEEELCLSTTQNAQALFDF